MNRTAYRALVAALALTSVLSFAACGDQTPVNFYTPPAEAETGDKRHQNTITSFVTDNQALLEEVAEHICDEKGVSFYYFVGVKDDASRVDEMVLKNGSYVRRETRDRVLKKLAKTRFVGEVTHSDKEPDVVSFYTHMRNETSGFYFVYCKKDNAVEYLSHDFLTGETSVTVTFITGAWYCVEVI